MANALVLGGGAPIAPLMNGALVALDEEGVKFDVIAASGAGIMTALSYASPKQGNRRQALASIVNAGIHPSIFKRFPINYKVFSKPSMYSRPYMQMVSSWIGLLPRKSDEQRFVSDFMALCASMCAPSSLTMDSLGMCEPIPLLEDAVDFAALGRYDGELLINAWNIRKKEMAIFPKEQITPAHVRAAMAFPLLYAPFELDGDLYYEGASQDTLNLKGLLDSTYMRKRLYQRELVGSETWLNDLFERLTADGKFVTPHKLDPSILADLTSYAPDIGSHSAGAKQAVERRLQLMGTLGTTDHLIVFDVVSNKDMIRRPRNLFDAWLCSIMVPLVALAADDLDLFELKHLPKYPSMTLHKIKFSDQLPTDQISELLDWSESNMRILYHAGYRAGKAFFAENHSFLLPSQPSLPTS